jgi:membrane protease subunit (stomatin/prohibitin family)
MGFIKAFAGAVKGTFADQWLDYIEPVAMTSTSAIIFPATKKSQNNGKGENTKGFDNVISDGSKIVVPENMALITLQDGAITGCITEPGGYTFSSNDPNARSLFAGDGIFASTLGASWEKFKYGGMPSSQQYALYINLRVIPGNKFGTQEPVRWMDNFFETQVGGVLRGSYNIQVIDPISFLKNAAGAEYMMPEPRIFDMEDMDNKNANQFFVDFIAVLKPALQNYASTKARENPDVSSVESIMSDTMGLAKVVGDTVEEKCQWKSLKGVDVVAVNIESFDYDEQTKELLAEVQQDDKEIRKAKRMGQAYANNPGMMAAAAGQAMQNAAANPNGAMMGFMGMNMAQAAGGNMMGAYGQPAAQPAQPVAGAVVGGAAPAAAEDPTAKIMEAKKLLDAGAISEEEFNQLKSKYLGL